MSRTGPSQADQELIRQAWAAGYLVSVSQLERWRSRGLLPRSRAEYLGRLGTRRVYPSDTEVLVCALARHSQPRRPLRDVALLAFFEGAPVPELALKTALAQVYFTHDRNTSARAALAKKVPADLRLTPDYEVAEAEAKLELRSNDRAVRQMRINLRRLPELQCATREEVDDRLLGVLVALNRIALPAKDLDVMSDLATALDMETLENGIDEHWAPDDVLAVWEWAAVSHAAQMAEYRETSPEERLSLLFLTPKEDLVLLREEVRDHFDQMWARAGGRGTSAPWHEPWFTRGAAAVLVEWMSARLVHPAGSRLAERYMSESLAHLLFACMLADVDRARSRGASPEEVEALMVRLFGGARDDQAS